MLKSTEDGFMIRKWPAEHGLALQPKLLVTIKVYLSASFGRNISEHLWARNHAKI